MTRILLVGCGHMGMAMLKYMIKNKKLAVSVVDLKVLKMEECEVFHNFQELTGKLFDILIYAVKPNQFRDLKDNYDPVLHENSVVISIMAGVGTDELQEKHRDKTIVRMMPNLGIEFGHSALTAFTTNKSFQSKIEEVFPSITWFDKEEDVGVLARLNGSGPGLFFAFCDALVKPYIKKGYDPNVLKKLAAETMLGSALVGLNKSSDFNTLKNEVATPGGITEAVLQILEPQLYTLVSEGLDNPISKVKK